MNIDEANINVKVDAAQPIAVNVEDGHKIDVVVGDAAKMECTKAINYIQSGQAEINVAVEDGISDFNTNALNKTTDFDNNYMLKKSLIDNEVLKASIWAEGSDIQVEALGGEHSAKGWADLTSQELSSYTPTDDLAAVALSGAYSDLTGTPTIPAAQVNSDWNAVSGVAQILNKPTIPTVNNSTITITQGGVTKGSFTLNQASGDTIALDAGASVDWGDITGTLSDQTDLNTALGNKANTDADNFTATGKSTIAELPMPSDSYVALTPVEPGSLLVTAPANGYAYLEGTSTASVSYCSLTVNNLYSQISWCTAGVTNGLFAFVPSLKSS